MSVCRLSMRLKGSEGPCWGGWSAVPFLAALIAGAPQPHLSHALVLFLCSAGVGVSHHPPERQLRDFMCISLLGDLPVLGVHLSHSNAFFKKKTHGERR